MNGAHTVMRLNPDPGRSTHGPASDPPPTARGPQSSWLASRLSPGEAGILAAFAASVSALIVIWGMALGYLRF